jgi:glycine cleavage system H protein
MSIKYTPDHEWINIDGNLGTVGITQHAQDALGDVVFVDLPEVGKTYAQKDAVAVVESANSDPMGAGWFFKVKLANPADLDALMDETSYTSYAADAH